MAAALGNQYAAKERRWRMAIDAALEQVSRVDQVNALNQIAVAMINAALDPSEKLSDRLGVWKELAERLDGKVPQAIQGDPESPLIIQVVKAIADNIAPRE